MIATLPTINATPSHLTPIPTYALNNRKYWQSHRTAEEAQQYAVNEKRRDRAHKENPISRYSTSLPFWVLDLFRSPALKGARITHRILSAAAVRGASLAHRMQFPWTNNGPVSTVVNLRLTKKEEYLLRVFADTTHIANPHAVLRTAIALGLQLPWAGKGSWEQTRIHPYTLREVQALFRTLHRPMFVGMNRPHYMRQAMLAKVMADKPFASRILGSDAAIEAIQACDDPYTPDTLPEDMLPPLPTPTPLETSPRSRCVVSTVEGIL